MSKGKDVKCEVPSYDNEEIISIIPEVTYKEPKIKIYDYTNDGTYWFSKIGFNRKITDES